MLTGDIIFLIQFLEDRESGIWWLLRRRSTHHGGSTHHISSTGVSIDSSVSYNHINTIKFFAIRISYEF